jgi:type IV secretion system protein VirD4
MTFGALTGGRTVLLALILIALLLFLVYDRKGKANTPRGARWATRKDVAPRRVRGPTPGRVILGRHDRRLIAADDRASTIVMGATQLAGKSSRIVIPAVLEWQGPLLTTSIKRDVLDATIRRREDLGE